MIISCIDKNFNIRRSDKTRVSDKHQQPIFI